jgi:hypothetical protein
MSTATLEQACASTALQSSPIPALRNLSLEESERTIVIRGVVPTYYLKQMAQETVMPLLAGRELQNRVRVERC